MICVEISYEEVSNPDLIERIFLNDGPFVIKKISYNEEHVIESFLHIFINIYIETFFRKKYIKIYKDCYRKIF